METPDSTPDEQVDVDPVLEPKTLDKPESSTSSNNSDNGEPIISDVNSPDKIEREEKMEEKNKVLHEDSLPSEEGVKEEEKSCKFQHESDGMECSNEFQQDKAEDAKAKVDDIPTDNYNDLDGIKEGSNPELTSQINQNKSETQNEKTTEEIGNKNNENEPVADSESTSELNTDDSNKDNVHESVVQETLSLNKTDVSPDRDVSDQSDKNGDREGVIEGEEEDIVVNVVPRRDSADDPSGNKNGRRVHFSEEVKVHVPSSGNPSALPTSPMTTTTQGSNTSGVSIISQLHVS